MLKIVNAGEVFKRYFDMKKQGSVSLDQFVNVFKKIAKLNEGSEEEKLLKTQAKLIFERVTKEKLTEKQFISVFGGNSSENGYELKSCLLMTLKQESDSEFLKLGLANKLKAE